MTAPDYARLIDAEMWDFIRTTTGFGTDDPGIPAQRTAYDAMCRQFHAGRPQGLTVRDGAEGGVPVRCYAPELPSATLVYFHGGGFVVGGLHSHDDICAELAARCGLRVVSVDYRLAPEHPHPAAFEDARSAARAVAARNGGPLLLAGDSAGGNLAAAVAHATRDDPVRACGQVLIYPGLGGDPDRGSYLEHADAPMLSRAEVLQYDVLRAGSPEAAAGLHADPTAAPLRDTDFRALPASAIFAAQCDPLADDSRSYAARLRAAGVAVRLTVEPGLVHGYLRARHRAARARGSFDRICSAVTDLQHAHRD